MEPAGGTELQLKFLEETVSKELLDKVQITTSVPEKIPLHPSKINILWQKNSYDQQNLAPWFKDKTNHSKYDWYVFNSHWNYEKFRMMFDLPTNRCTVIKNGLKNITLKDKFYKKGDKLKLIYHSTPWRGLNILLGAMQLVNINCELDVYSSTQIYGDNFKKTNDSEYLSLYEQAKQLPNVNYIGYKPHSYILENLHTYDAFVYPCIWEETFCNCALESLATGLYVATTNLGALFETCAEFPVYVPYEKNEENLCKQFAHVINTLPDQLVQQACVDQLKFQQKYFNYFYNWDRLAFNWTNFLSGVVNAK